MTIDSSYLRLAFIISISLAGACGDDDDKEDHGEESAHGGETVPDCQAIVDACHTVDEGKGEAYECHSQIAHENDATRCAKEKARCVAFCVAAGGGGDGGAANHDGGH